MSASFHIMLRQQENIRVNIKINITKQAIDKQLICEHSSKYSFNSALEVHADIKSNKQIWYNRSRSGIEE